MSVLGGGHGTYQILAGFRDHEDVSLTAVVTATDSGGDSGRLRDEFGILPPGDLRQCFLALCEDGHMLRDLLGYRFEEEPLRGRQLGNLFFLALTRLHGSEQAAIRALHKILRTRGHVMPSTWDKVQLCAELGDGRIIEGEAHIDVPRHDPSIPIRRVFLKPSAAPNLDALDALSESDFIVFAPGDLFTSLIPILLVRGMADVLQRTRARLIQSISLMTKRGETDGYAASHYVEQVAKYIGRLPDAVLAHEGELPEEMSQRYLVEQSQPVTIDEDRLRVLGVPMIHAAPLIADARVARHDPALTAVALRDLFARLLSTS